MTENDWIFALKSRIKRSRRLATAVFYLTDLAYLDLRERRRFVASFPPGARLLNLGAGFRASPPGFLAVDRELYPEVGLVGDLLALPLRSASADGILCEMVLEHLPDAAAALREFHRVLRPGGRIYLAVPFLWPYHASPHDYRRWTQSGADRDFAGFEKIAAGISGGPTATLVNVLHEWLAMALSLNVEALYRIFYLALMPFLFPWKLLDVMLSKHRHAGKIAALLYFHGRKPGALPEAPANPVRFATR